jgi:sodium/potassium/calcium exchanger 4
MLVVAGLYLTISGILALFGLATSPIRYEISEEEKENNIAKTYGRRLLEDTSTTSLNCTPHSIDEFPADFMTASQRASGGVIVHILIAVYSFAALAIVCDDYFVASLERISDVLGLQPDVAGATFMAAGSSAPELFTSLIGVFLTKSDVGVGTIVGSAVFNILFIIGICGIFSGMIIYLTWWPMVRDCFFYTISVVALIIIIQDEVVHWYEATILIVIYFVYILVMYFNQRLGDYMTRIVNEWQMKKKLQKQNRDLALGISSPNSFQEKSPLLQSKEAGISGGYPTQHRPSEEDRRTASFQRSYKSYHSASFHRSFHNSYPDGTDTEFESPFTLPARWFQRIIWVITLPISCVFVLTIPDCRRPGCWRKTFIITFIMSIVWIAALSYIMVWMVTIVGDTFSIPDTVMGLTLLAAGTSVPDAMASLFVARDGYGDMAVSNCIGSNVFDILIGLGIPWLLQTGIVEPNSTVPINSGGLVFSAITLLATVIFMISAVSLTSWRLDKMLGVSCLVVYVIFVVFSCMYELNVFGPFSPPPCPRI